MHLTGTALRRCNFIWRICETWAAETTCGSGGCQRQQAPENLQETVLVNLHRVLDSYPLSIWNLEEYTGRLTPNAHLM